MAKFHVYLKGMGDHSVITIGAAESPNLATAEPILKLGKSSFRLSEVVAVVAAEDLQH